MLFGAVTYVWGCFLPIFLIRIPFARSLTLYNQIVDPSSGSSAMKSGGSVLLFAGVATVAALALIGALRVFRPWALAAMVGAVVVWSLTSIALLVVVISTYTSPRWGYWILLSSVGCVVAGTIVILVTRGSTNGKISEDDRRMDLDDLDTRARFGLPDPPDPIDYERSGEVRTERVLIIDDDRDLARFVEVNLRGAGFPGVSTAIDGSAGLERICQEDFDLVICNFVMPGLLGDEVVRRIRAEPRTRNLPVVMLTAKAGATYIGRAMEAGADDYIIKPFDPIELMAHIQAVLRRRAVG